MKTYVGADFVGKTVEAVFERPGHPPMPESGTRSIAVITFTDGTFTFLWGDMATNPADRNIFIFPYADNSWAMRYLVPFGICTKEDVAKAEGREEAERAAKREEGDREEYARLKAKYGDPAHQKEGG